MFELIILFFEGVGKEKGKLELCFVPFIQVENCLSIFRFSLIMNAWSTCWRYEFDVYGWIHETNLAWSFTLLMECRLNFSQLTWDETSPRNKFHRSEGGMGSEVEASSDNRKYYEILDIYLSFLLSSDINEELMEASLATSNDNSRQQFPSALFTHGTIQSLIALREIKISVWNRRRKDSNYSLKYGTIRYH